MADPVTETTPASAPAPIPVEVKPIIGNPPAPGTVEPTYPQSHVHELREEAAGWRKKFREAEGVIKELSPLKEKVPQLEAQIRSYKVDGALGEAITKAGLNPKLTKALIRDEIGALDPDKEDFGKSLTALVKKAGEDNPELKMSGAPAAAVIPGKAGSDITHPQTATPVAQDQLTKADLARMRAAGDHEGIAKAVKEGKFKAVLGQS